MIEPDCLAAWAAGIFEGEGCFTVDRLNHGSPRLVVVTTDLDVLHRFHEAVGMRGTICEVTRKNAAPHWKTPWHWAVTNEQEVLAVMTLFLPWLGERRRERWNEIWSAWMDHCSSLLKECESCGDKFAARDHRSRYCSSEECRRERNRRISRRSYHRLREEMV